MISDKTREKKVVLHDRLTAIKGREVKDSNSPNAKLADVLETSHREEPNRVDSIYSSSDGSYESESSDFENEAQ